MIEFSTNSSVQFAKPTLVFNGGELHPTLEIKQEHNKQPVVIFALIKTAQDVMELLMVKDAVNRLVGKKVPIRLRMPYIPYARQDRVANKGEALSIKVFCDLINDMKFDRVEVYDSHSPVALALLDNVVEQSQEDILPYEYHAQDIVVAPDAGAMKKAEKFASRNGLPLIYASKSRNTINGELSAPNINYTNQVTKEFIKTRLARGGSLVVVDDICDGGGTFIQLGKKFVEDGLLAMIEEGYGEDAVCSFKGAKLLVTHGIFACNAKAKLIRYYSEVAATIDWTKGE